MKTVKLFFIFFMMSGLSACLDTEEYIVINEDNSGVYTLTMDMGKVIGMLSQMGGEEISNKGGLGKIDSTIYVKDMISAADNLTAEEIALYKDAIVKIKMDTYNEEMKIIMTCPFKSLDRLPEIKNNFYAVMNKIKAFDKLPGKENEQNESPVEEGMAEKALTPNAAYYQFLAEPGKIEYSIKDTVGFRNLVSSDSTMIMMQQMTALMGEITYITRIKTAREIKNYSGNKASLSTDKKTIIFSSTFSEILGFPEKSAYKIEY